MPKFDVQPKEAQLIFDMLAKHLRNGIMLRLMPELEQQVTIGFLKKLKAAAEYLPPIKVQLKYEVVRDADPVRKPAEPARDEPGDGGTAPSSPSPSGLDPRSGRRSPGGQRSS